MSLRARLTLLFTATMAALLCLMMVGLGTWSRQQSEQQAHDALATAARQLTAEVQSPEAGDTSEEDASMLASYNVVLLRPGSVLASDSDRRHWRSLSITIGGQKRLIAYRWDAVEAGLEQQHRLLLMLVAVVTAIGSCGAWLLVGYVLRPIGRLATEVDAASAESLTVRLHTPSNDIEMVGLVRTLNGLLQRLEDSMALKGQFHAAASHELRTPLQALSGHLELALSQPRNETEYRAFCEEAFRQVRRLTVLVRDLLSWSQLESSPPTPVETVDLVDVCGWTLDSLQPVMRARHLQVEVHAPDHAPVSAAPGHVELLLRNLLENAVKYSPADGQVVISINPDLRIFNQLQGQPDWDPEKLFEPFYRPDSSRQSGIDGTGLGLAMCRTVCRLNHWELVLQPRPDGVEVTVSGLAAPRTK